MKKYTTISDAGSVRIGNDNFRYLIGNGYGDCDTRVIVLDVGEEPPTTARFVDSIIGKDINIYTYDCENSGELSESIKTTITGKYHIYREERVVYFAKRD